MKQLHEYETRITDNEESIDNGETRPLFDVMRDLERKLAMCRDALKEISAIAENTAANEEDQITQNAIIESALEATEATEPKQ